MKPTAQVVCAPYKLDGSIYAGILMQQQHSVGKCCGIHLLGMPSLYQCCSPSRPWLHQAPVAAPEPVRVSLMEKKVQTLSTSRCYSFSVAVHTDHTANLCRHHTHDSATAHQIPQHPTDMAIV